MTKLGPETRGAVVVSGSHGGRYCGYLALKAQVRAVILNDAGIGKDDAGIASLADVEPFGLAAATVSNMSCRIGDAADMIARGVISHANAPARAAGVAPGMSGREAAERLRAAPHVERHAAAGLRGPLGAVRAGLAAPHRADRLRLDGACPRMPDRSSSRPRTARCSAAIRKWRCRSTGSPASTTTPASASRAGAITRLPALDGRGIAGMTVSAASARIGDARSVYEDGVISHINATAAAMGAAVDMALKPLLTAWARRV